MDFPVTASVIITGTAPNNSMSFPSAPYNLKAHLVKSASVRPMFLMVFVPVNVTEAPVSGRALSVIT